MKNKGLLDIVENEIKDIPVYYSSISNKSSFFRVIWEQAYLPFLLKKWEVDILFCPGNIAPIYTKCKTVQWVGTIGPFFKDFYKNFPLKIRFELFVNKLLFLCTQFHKVKKYIHNQNF